jgi:hypothetical protein
MKLLNPSRHLCLAHCCSPCPLSRAAASPLPSGDLKAVPSSRPVAWAKAAISCTVATSSRPVARAQGGYRCVVGKAKKRSTQGVGGTSSTRYSHGGTCACSMPLRVYVLHARVLRLCMLCAANICKISSGARCLCSALRRASLLCASRFHPHPYADNQTLLHCSM